jgi:hypothetical protein
MVQGCAEKTWMGPLILLTVCCLLLAAVFTWPLALHPATAIPYTLYPQQGYDLYPLMPGDHLQTFYWFWVARDNILGGSPFHTNPFEFNGAHGPMVGGYANFPFSLLYVALSPLGTVAAYNVLLVLSFLASGGAGWLFARSLVGGRWVPLLAGLLFACFPLRIAALAGGQLFGFLVFFLPLTFFLVEKTIATGGWRWGLGAAGCLALMGSMEGHLAFFGTLFLGLYLPGRFLLSRPPATAGCGEGTREEAPWIGGVMVVLAGAALALFAAHRADLWHSDATRSQLLEALAAWIPLTVVLWLACAALIDRFTASGFAAARNGAARIFLPLLVLPIGAAAGTPSGKVWVAAAGLAAAGIGLRLLLRAGGSRPEFPWRRIVAACAWTGAGIGVATALLLSHRAKNIVSSIAGKGRGLGEVLLFSSPAERLFVMAGDGREQFILLGAGLVALAALGLGATLRRTPPADSGRRALCGLLGLLGALLAVGPTMRAFPLYETLYLHVPYFNYPRVPSRLVPFAIMFLGVLACDGLADLYARLPERGKLLRPAVFAGAALLLLVPFHSFRPMGLTLFPPLEAFARQVRAEPAHGGRDLVLELPLWPGDSHQSSAYEYDVSLTRRPMVNGYSPLVSTDYLKQVVAPLSPLNLGQLGEVEAKTLRDARVNIVTFHDDAMIYTAKVSPFPPRLAEKRLAASGWLDPIGRDGKISLFRLRDAPLPAGRPESITSPVAAVLYAFSLSPQVGKRGWDPAAGGYFLQTDPGSDGVPVPFKGAPGNLIVSPAGTPDGWLVKGPARGLPAGNYEAGFRLRVPGGGPAAGRLEIAGGDGRVLASRVLLPGDFPGNSRSEWTDLLLPFALTQITQVECRIWREGPAPLDLNLITVRFAGAGTGPGSFEAEDLLRQTGEVVASAEASGGEAVVARRGIDPPLYLLHGPYRTVAPGRYLARFHVRARNLHGAPGAPVARFEAATDMGRRVFASRTVTVGECANVQEAGVIELAFTAPTTCELDLRVRYAGGGDLSIDLVDLVRAP